MRASPTGHCSRRSAPVRSEEPTNDDCDFPVSKVQADARSLPFVGGSFVAVVCSLGDAYNCRELWRELSRVLAVEGLCCYTSPTFEWANAYRGEIESTALDKARFELVDGSIVDVDSEILTMSKQIEVAKAAGLKLLATTEIGVEQLTGKVSPKLLGSETIVIGYLFSRE